MIMTTTVLLRSSSVANAPKVKVKVHKRSRNGCRNCKIRNVKCDETHPCCKRCQSYGVQCNFTNKSAPELQLAAAGVQQYLVKPWCCVPSPHLTDLKPWRSREDGLLVKFQSDVALTMSFGKRMAVFQNEIVRLSDSYSFLRHAILSLTMMYEHHHGELSHYKQATTELEQLYSRPEDEVRHWYLATLQFSKILASALTKSPQEYPSINEQAALQATTALLVLLSFCYVEARTPEEAWPLAHSKQSSASEDLAWIKLSNGKIAAQSLTQGLMTDPIFRALVHVDSQESVSFPLDLTWIPSLGFESLLELDQTIYGTETATLMSIRDSRCLLTIIFTFWSFIGGMTVGFEKSLKLKEPAALILLLYWYAKLNPLPVWWLKTRTSLEGRAICKYLDQYHSEDAAVKRMLYWPASILCPIG